MYLGCTYGWGMREQAGCVGGLSQAAEGCESLFYACWVRAMLYAPGACYMPMPLIAPAASMPMPMPCPSRHPLNRPLSTSAHCVAASTPSNTSIACSQSTPHALAASVRCGTVVRP